MAWGACLLVGYLGALIWTVKRRRFILAWTLAVAGLFYAPVSGVIPFGSRGPADSYLYLPLAFGALALAEVASRQQTKTARRVIGAITVLGALACIPKTRADTRDWRDAVTLWSEVAALNPENPAMQARVGVAYLFERQPDRALAIYEALEREHPAFLEARIHHSAALEALGRLPEAERVLANAAEKSRNAVFHERYAFFLLDHVELAPSQPIIARRALSKLGRELLERGKRPRTIRLAADRMQEFGNLPLAEQLRARAERIEGAN
jgi:tetratricopeptide (TPR) repeat protein